MRILYVSQGYSCHDLRFCRCLVEDGASVLHLRLEPERVRETRPYPPGAIHLDWRSEGALSVWRRILRERPDLVLAGPVPTGAFLSGWATLALRIPLVAMAWGSDMLLEVEHSAVKRLAARFALAVSAGAFGDCEAVRRSLLRLSRLAPERVLCLPWGVDVERFSPAPPPARRAGRVLISTRHWEPIYGIEVLFKAFLRVARQVPDLRLRLVGDGSMAHWVKSFLRDQGLEERVETPGRLRNDELVECLRTSDLYVSSALSDGSSVSLLEAMACGLPAVVPDTGGNPEWVQPGTNGWLYSPGDAGALEGALLEALQSQEHHLRGLGSAGRRIAEQRADWRVNSPALSKFLFSIRAEQRVH